MNSNNNQILQNNCQCCSCQNNLTQPQLWQNNSCQDNLTQPQLWQTNSCQLDCRLTDRNITAPVTSPIVFVPFNGSISIPLARIEPSLATLQLANFNQPRFNQRAVINRAPAPTEQCQPLCLPCNQIYKIQC